MGPCTIVGPWPRLYTLVLLIGLTGNIASGKSSVAALMQRKGAWLIDADVLAREAVAAGSAGLSAIVERWGSQVLDSQGGLNRAALRQIVFTNAAEREALNAIVHPEVERLRLTAIERARESGAPIVVCDIPLLFEKGLESLFDVVILVDASDAIRLERLMRTRGLPEDEARSIMAAQWPAAGKRALADLVIENAGSLEALKEHVGRAWSALQRRVDRR